MNYYYTYHQADTTTIKKLKDLSSTVEIQSSLDIGIKPIPKENLRIDTVQRKREVTQTPVKTQRVVTNRPRVVAKVDTTEYVKPYSEVTLETNTLVKPSEIVLPARRINKVDNDWLTVFLLFALLLFASVRQPFANYISHLFKATLNYPTSTRMYRERSYSFVDGAFRLDIIFYIVFSLFVYQVLDYYKPDLPFQSFTLFLASSVGVLGYFVAKRIFYLMIGFLNKGQQETDEYLFNLNNYNRVLGLFLFPVVTIIAFSPIFKPVFFVVFGLIFTIIFYGMSLQRGVLILLKKQFSIFYLFLYLCTLEILPLLLIYKMVIE